MPTLPDPSSKVRPLAARTRRLERLRPGRDPLIVQFWLLGLDALSGDLERIGYRRSPHLGGSSLYLRGALTLHSSALSLCQSSDYLAYDRRHGCFFTCGALPVPGQLPADAPRLARARGLDLLHDLLLEHERDILHLHSPDYRHRQLSSGRIPSRVRREIAVWNTYLGLHPDRPHPIPAAQVPGITGAPI